MQIFVFQSKPKLERLAVLVEKLPSSKIDSTIDTVQTNHDLLVHSSTQTELSIPAQATVHFEIISDDANYSHANCFSDTINKSNRKCSGSSENETDSTDSESYSPGTLKQNFEGKYNFWIGNLQILLRKCHYHRSCTASIASIKKIHEGEGIKFTITCWNDHTFTWPS